MSQKQAQAQTDDPSMEDILASIRKIISDDEPNDPTEESKQEEVPKMAKAAKAVESAPQEEELLELTDIIEDEEPESADVVEEELNMSEEEPMEEMSEIEPENNITSISSEDDSHIVSDAVGQPSSTAFNQLSEAVSKINAISMGNGSVTLESIVRQSLKPLLKEWIDTHLVGIVEGIVKEEVDKIVKKIEGINK